MNRRRKAAVVTGEVTSWAYRGDNAYVEVKLDDPEHMKLLVDGSPAVIAVERPRPKRPRPLPPPARHPNPSQPR
jgi:hypothetical protein